MAKLTDLASWLAPIPIRGMDGMFLPSDFEWTKLGTEAEVSDMMERKGGDTRVLTAMFERGFILDEDGAPFDPIDLSTQPKGRVSRMATCLNATLLAGGIPFPKMPPKKTAGTRQRATRTRGSKAQQGAS